MSSKKTIEKTKLIKLLSTFSTLEWKRFGRFVQSPYHNTNPQVISLYTILKKAFPFEKAIDLEQERLYKKVYGKELFVLSKFQNLCSDLYELATDFMVDVHLKEEKQQMKKLVVEALFIRNYDLFKGASQQLAKEIETQDYFLDEDDFLLLYQLNDKLFHHVEKDSSNIQNEGFEKSWTYLNAFYKHKQVAFKAENKGSQNFLNQHIDSTDIRDNQLTELFLRVIDLHKSKEASVYFELKQDVLKHWGKLKIQHKTNLLVHLLNFSFTNELIQKEFGYKEALGLYKIGIEDNIFIINGKMRDIEFFNISMIGFKYETEEWTIDFIESHKLFLLENDRQFLVPLSYAYNAIFKNDFEQVIDLLKEITPYNKRIYLDKIKALLVRAYFEAIIHGFDEYRSSFHYEIEAMKKSITRNNKLSAIKLDARYNFLILLKKLLVLNDNGANDIEKINSFHQLIQETTPLLLKHWLIEKYLQIKNAALDKDSIRG